MAPYTRLGGSVRTLRYCGFLFCWSVFVLTVICVFGGYQPNIPIEYTTDPSYPATATAPRRRIVDNHLPLDPIAFEVVPRNYAIDGEGVAGPEGLFMDVVRRIERNVPSLPVDFWGRHQLGEGQNGVQSECAKLPSILDLEYNNEYWQRQRTSNGTFELLGAYLDNRKDNPNGDQFVRILGTVDRVNVKESVQMYCQLWYDNLDESFVVPLDTYNYIWYKEWGQTDDGELQPHLLSCRLPKERRNTVPVAVSLVENKCDLATNCLRVTYNKPISEHHRKPFAVCVKGLDFLYDDLSARLVEWIELLSILGADKIFFYDLQVHPNIQKVLEYYVKQGRVEVQKTKLPGGLPNIPGLQHMYLKDRLSKKRQLELIPYNDCFYRNMYRYEYIALLDIDEVIMPTEDIYDWHQLMQRVQNRIRNSSTPDTIYASYGLRNIYFLDRFYTAKQKPVTAEFNPELPDYLHMVRHTARATEYTKLGCATKCFHNTANVITLHNHFPISCTDGYCNSYDISEADAQMNHYRKDCTPIGSKDCDVAKAFVEDNSIGKYRTKLVKRSLSTLLQLGLVRAKL